MNFDFDFVAIKFHSNENTELRSMQLDLNFLEVNLIEFD